MSNSLMIPLFSATNTRCSGNGAKRTAVGMFSPLQTVESLKRSEGKWPEYPRELIRLARAHDLSVPGAMLPGPPKGWDRLYGPRPPAPKTPAAGEEG